MEHMSEYSWMKYLVMFAEKPWRLYIAFLLNGYRNCVHHVREIYSNSFISTKCPCVANMALVAMTCIVVVMRTLCCYLKREEISG